MDFDLPQDLVDYLAELDAFIEAKIKPLQAQDDNERFFDHRREHARTDWDNNGLPRKEWEELLAKARKLADEAGHLRYAWPPEMGGKGGSQGGSSSSSRISSLSKATRLRSAVRRRRHRDGRSRARRQVRAAAAVL